ncbi:MAG TPA: hypothetical protein VKU01_22345 [Bryobacteraceae bacterium]|nr:hypothetical protein [Bryobacteraceae bacterium]
MNIRGLFVVLIALIVTPALAENKLWVAAGVDKSLYTASETSRLEVSFVVINDGDATVDPEVEGSHLLINGKEPEDWSIVIANGIRAANYRVLPPGGVLEFNYQLGPRYFAKPGVYTLRWEVGKFRSAEMTFRVLPAPSVK